MTSVDLDTAPLTVVHALRRNRVFDTHGHTFLDNAGKPTFFSFRELCDAAEQRARVLLGTGLTHGDRVAIVLPQPQDFVITFLGALVAGLVPVPMFPPLSFGKLDAYADTAVSILQVAGARLIVTDKALSSVLWQTVPRVKSIRDLLVVEAMHSAPVHAGPLPEITPDDLAFLQFTSGSTSMPKGVMVSHRSLVANCWSIAATGMEIHHETDVAISWLPLYHDMGLIGFVLTPLFRAVSAVFIPTLSFVKRPNVWMQTMHDYRGTLTFGPNFAFALAAKRASDEDLARWDLSCIRCLGCGAEPINAQVMLEFVDRFERSGLAAGAVMPAYGMAEATLAMSFARLGEELSLVLLDADTFRATGEVRDPEDDAVALSFVGCGQPFPGHEIAIMDGDAKILGADREGEIAFRGPSVTDGYWQNPEATAAVFRDGWVHTGDLGFLHDGDIFITGRCKDLIILNGRNHHPQTIEWAVAELDAVRKGNVVAFSRPGTESEELVVVAEVKPDSELAVGEAIRRAVADQLSLKVSDVVLLRPGQLPKTSSGKLQRRKTRDQYLKGELGHEGVRTLGATGEKLVVARHIARGLLGRATHAARNALARASD